jgi:hypothetical protein
MVAVDPSNPIVWVVAAALLAAILWAINASSKPMPEIPESKG